MESAQLDSWAAVLNSARLKAQPIQQLSQQIQDKGSPRMARKEAYAIQEKQLQLRLAAGEKQLGWKMGLTSEAKRRQMNLDSPLYGFLTDQMQIPNAGAFALAGKIHPKIEPEVAFLIGQDLSGKITRDQALQACSAVCAALEILDSRYTQFKYFSMEDVISDNSSSCSYILGPWEKSFKSMDLSNLKMKMSVQGEVVQSGNSKDISGDPLISIVQLCELLSERSQVLKAGSVVLAGAATAAVELKPGMKVELEVEQLPTLSVYIKEAL